MSKILGLWKSTDTNIILELYWLSVKLRRILLCLVRLGLCLVLL